jgi:hypothetical protein
MKTNESRIRGLFSVWGLNADTFLWEVRKNGRSVIRRKTCRITGWIDEQENVCLTVTKY